ncbi:hypothetical protein ONZ45_g10061 [Pleurotus djamor]|nr:hypothetical protein ONZ45_g10061 [Pleurotus djamor]
MMMFTRIPASALILASVAYALSLPRTSGEESSGATDTSGSTGGSSCSPNSLLCCDAQTTEDLLSGVAGTLQSVVAGLLSGGPTAGCESGGATACATQPLCCTIPVLHLIERVMLPDRFEPLNSIK